MPWIPPLNQSMNAKFHCLILWLSLSLWLCGGIILHNYISLIKMVTFKKAWLYIESPCERVLRSRYLLWSHIYQLPIYDSDFIAYFLSLLLSSSFWFWRIGHVTNSSQTQLLFFFFLLTVSILIIRPYLYLSHAPQLKIMY